VTVVWLNSSIGHTSPHTAPPYYIRLVWLGWTLEMLHGELYHTLVHLSMAGLAWFHHGVLLWSVQSSIIWLISCLGLRHVLAECRYWVWVLCFFGIQLHFERLAIMQAAFDSFLVSAFQLLHEIQRPAILNSSHLWLYVLFHVFCSHIGSQPLVVTLVLPGPCAYLLMRKFKSIPLP
jgi:hypothetical protein